MSEQESMQKQEQIFNRFNELEKKLTNLSRNVKRGQEIVQNGLQAMLDEKHITIEQIEESIMDFQRMIDQSIIETKQTSDQVIVELAKIKHDTTTFLNEFVAQNKPV